MKTMLTVLLACMVSACGSDAGGKRTYCLWVWDFQEGKDKGDTVMVCFYNDGTGDFSVQGEETDTPSEKKDRISGSIKVTKSNSTNNISSFKGSWSGEKDGNGKPMTDKDQPKGDFSGSFNDVENTGAGTWSDTVHGLSGGWEVVSWGDPGQSELDQD